MVNILHIQFHPVVERGIAAAVDLPEAGNPRPHTEAAAVPVFVETFIVSHFFTDCVHPANPSLFGDPDVLPVVP
jgi:hypothetical protein